MITNETLQQIVAAGNRHLNRKTCFPGLPEIPENVVDAILVDVVEMAQEIQRLRAENDELRQVVEHPPSVEKLIGNLADSLVSAGDEIDRLRKQLSGNTGDVTPQQEAECDCDGRRRWRCPNPLLVCTQQEVLKEGKWA